MSAAGPLKVEPTSEPRQYSVRNAKEATEIDDGTLWDDYYVRFSGYFGDHGPSVFAAAPELLSALKLASSLLELHGYEADGPSMHVINAAISKAKGCN